MNQTFSNSSLWKGQFGLSDAERLDIFSLPLVEHTVMMYGKPTKLPRKIGFFSNESEGYRFTGNIIRAEPLVGVLEAILERVNQQTESDFNAILINRYEGGGDYIGPHSDDERTLGRNGVVTISLGQQRIFRIRDKSTRAIVQDIIVEDGDMYWMQGEFQTHYTHEIPKQKQAGTRISLTFRRHLE